MHALNNRILTVVLMPSVIFLLSCRAAAVCPSEIVRLGRRVMPECASDLVLSTANAALLPQEYLQPGIGRELDFAALVQEVKVNTPSGPVIRQSR